ncbi:MAG: MIP/aquaporin family protein [Candidatus Poseidoniales archaeon]|jgi:glycerol uptake facilitator-like aquaporin|tara:strand:+ start:433 stop:1032 length:600 start_codon:yes stop_codon:yes gene_type:complete
MWNRYFAEFSGTFLMVLLGCGSVALGWSSLAISITFGVAVFTAIIIFQPISGAHINPAVSIAFAARGDLETKALPGYIIAQSLGAWFAAMIVVDGATIPSVSLPQSWGIEIAITLLLMYTIHILVRRKSSVFTLAFGVGLMISILSFTFGEFTGASMNPARTLGPNIVTGNGHLILYIVAPVIGAVISNFIPGPLDEEL